MKLKFPVILTDKIEEWLSNLVLEMKKTLKSLLVECLQTGAGDMMAFPQQIGIGSYLHENIYVASK